MVTTHDMSAHICPRCGTTQDRASNIEEGVDSPPTDGDITICFQCAAILYFRTDKDNGSTYLQEPSPEELQKALQLPLVVQAVGEIMKLRGIKLE